jgi:hypothetical protein
MVGASVQVRHSVAVAVGVTLKPPSLIKTEQAVIKTRITIHNIFLIMLTSDRAVFHTPLGAGFMPTFISIMFISKWT